MKKLLMTLTALSLLLVACGGTAIQKNASYKSALDLRDAYVASGAVKEPDCDEKITQDAKAQWGWQTVNRHEHRATCCRFAKRTR